MSKKKEETPFVFLETPNRYKLASYHTHDFKSKEENGCFYFMDGGQESFVRVGGDKPPIISTIEAEIEWIREDFKWTSTKNKNGKLLKTPITKKLKNLSRDHVETLVKYTSGWISKLMEVELKYRLK